MTIWILTLVLLASLAGLGYRQGAIRVAFSLVGIIIGGLLATPLGHLLTPLWKSLGVTNPVLQWALGPLVVFLIIIFIFKSVALVVHRRTMVGYKHAGDDIRFALWERMNRRVGLCLGLANGTVYLILASFAIYTPTYWTTQLGSATESSRTMKILNRLGNDLQSTGLSHVAGAFNTMPDAYYEAADTVGLIYNNPDLQGRLAHYPGFISLAEKQEFQDVANDPDIAEMRSRQASLSELLAQPKVQAITRNPDLLKTISDTLIPDLKDLRLYLTNGVSAKYDAEKILGKWDLNVNASYTAFRKGKPALPQAEIQRTKNWIREMFQKTRFVAGADHLAILKGIPKQQQPAGKGQAIEVENRSGQWESDGFSYKLKLVTDGKTDEITALLDNGRLVVNLPTFVLVFNREE